MLPAEPSRVTRARQHSAHCFVSQNQSWVSILLLRHRCVHALRIISYLEQKATKIPQRNPVDDTGQVNVKPLSSPSLAGFLPIEDNRISLYILVP